MIEKRCIYVIRVIGVIVISLAIMSLLDINLFHFEISKWLLSIGFLLAGVAFFIMCMLIRRHPILSSSFLTKCSRHGEDNNTYDK